MREASGVDERRPVPPTKDDVLAILKAHRDLGPEFDSHLADQILDLWPPSERRGRRHSPLIRPNGETPSARKKSHSQKISSVLALSIPLLAIAGGETHPHLYGVLAVLAMDAIAMVVLR